MADFLPPVVAMLKADIKDFSQKMSEARKTMGETAASGEKSAEQTKKAWATGALAVGGAALGLTAVLVKAGQAQERQGIVLRRVIENQGLAFKDYETEIGRTEDRMRKFGHSTAETRGALAKLTLATKDPNRAMEGMQLAADIAATKQISLGEAAGEVRKIMQGNSKVLKQYGVSMGDSKKAAQDLEQAQKEHGAAVERLKDAQQNLSDIQEVLAGKDKLSISDKHRLRDATNEVTDAQAGLTESSAKVTSAQTAAEEATKRLGSMVDEVGTKMKGVADAQAKTFAGRMEEIKTVIGDKAATAGEKLSGVLDGLSSVMGIAAGVVALRGTAAFKLLAGAAGFAGSALLLGAAGLVGVGFGYAAQWVISKTLPDLYAKMGEADGVFASFVRWVADASLGTDNWSKSLDGLKDRLGDTWLGKGAEIVKSGFLRTHYDAGPTQNLYRTAKPIPRMAEGGIVTSPTLAMVGEAGPEAVVPLKQMSQGDNHFHFYGVQGDASQIAQEVHKIFLRYQRRNPSLGFT